MKRSLSRRSFLQQSAVVSGLFFLPRRLPGQTASPSERLNVAVIGVAHQGNYNLNNVATQNIVALCDVDETYLAAAAQRFPGCKTYTDFRRLLDQPGIDAVVVATPDHTHAVASVAALNKGFHVYCEKPLTRTISETRIVTETARRNKRVTQIGTQIHAGENYRRVVELVRSGVIGPIEEVHVWVSASYGGKNAPAETPEIPQGLHWDLWLGPVKPRPYHPTYAPGSWRHWWAFGGGALADFGCHYLDLPHWALNLSQPLSAEAEGPPVHPDSTPPWLIVRYAYPARGQHPPVKLTWRHGGKKPRELLGPLAPQWQSGVLFIGKKGQILADYGRRMLLPESEFAGFQPPPQTIPNSVGHHKEWIDACKNGGKTTCAFDYSGPLTETALLGNVAYRIGKKIEWDSENLRAKNAPEADQYIRHEYRDGWKI